MSGQTLESLQPIPDATARESPGQNIRHAVQIGIEDLTTADIGIGLVRFWLDLATRLDHDVIKILYD